MIITGPFSLKYGSVAIDNVSEVSFEYSADSVQPTTIDGVTLDFPTTTSFSATVTILGADTKILAALFNEWGVMDGGTMSTQELYTEQTGDATIPAVDIKALSACGATTTKHDLELVGCGYTYRIVDATAKIDTFELADNIMVNVSIVFTSQPESYTDPADGLLKRHAMLQIFETGSLSDVPTS